MDRRGQGSRFLQPRTGNSSLFSLPDLILLVIVVRHAEFKIEEKVNTDISSRIRGAEKR